MKLVCLIFLLICFSSSDSKKGQLEIRGAATEVSLIVLGTVQDAGSPQIGCEKKCCKNLFLYPDHKRKVVSLGLVDGVNQKSFLFEATPDIAAQTKMLKSYTSLKEKELPDGVFLTHAHIGHYTGLMYFGKEATNADKMPVYSMPRMRSFLQQNGPWGQLVSNENIELVPLEHDRKLALSSSVEVIPFLIPHRDEYTEAVGYTIIGPSKKALFIPDIDKWEHWDIDICEIIAQVDYAFLDATFYDGDELPNRDLTKVLHPFVSESMELFSKLTPSERAKVYFIHLNHTNPLLNPESEQTKQVLENGFNIARPRQTFNL